jgi:centrin-3
MDAEAAARTFKALALRAMGFDLTNNDTLATIGEKMARKDWIGEIRKGFNLFDNDHTGKISLKNLRRLARELGEDLTDDDLQIMIDVCDTDHDGQIAEYEFIAIMKRPDGF